MTLKPIFGIAPGYYVTGVLSVLALLLLFALLYLPGLTSAYRDVTIESSPSGAALHHEGTRIGSTPDTISLPRGDQTLTLSRPGFQNTEIEIQVPERRFGTLFVPATTTAEVVLEPRAGLTETDSADTSNEGAAATSDSNTGHAADGEVQHLTELFARAGTELSRWAEIGESTSTRPIPPVLSTLSEDLSVIAAQAAADDPQKADAQVMQAEDFLLSSIQNVTSSPMARDLTTATWRMSSAAGTPSGLSATEMVHKFIHAHNNSEGLSLWLSDIAPSEKASAIRSSEIYQQFLEENEQLDSQYSETLSSEVEELTTALTGTEEQEISLVEGVPPLSFVPVPPGSVLLGYSRGLGRNDSEAVRSLRSVEAFHISRTPITRAQWQAFIDENPEWSPDNRDSLIDEGLVDSGYLSDDSDNGQYPITGVSFHAAEAFAAWADESTPDGWRISLPSERQWARAAGLDRYGLDDEALQFGFSTSARSLSETAERSGNLGLVDMLGNVWEWTSTPYYSGDTIVRLDPEYAEAGFPDMAVVRGGSWANAADEIGIESRGGQRTHWATPFLGFRLVAERTGD